MNPALLSPAPAPPELPAAHPSAAEAWDEICAGMGIVPLSPAESASLLPWTPEEAAEFKRTVEEAFENVEPAAA